MHERRDTSQAKGGTPRWCRAGFGIAILKRCLGQEYACEVPSRRKCSLSTSDCGRTLGEAHQPARGTHCAAIAGRSSLNCGAPGPGSPAGRGPRSCLPCRTRRAEMLQRATCGAPSPGGSRRSPPSHQRQQPVPVVSPHAPLQLPQATFQPQGTYHYASARRLYSTVHSYSNRSGFTENRIPHSPTADRFQCTRSISQTLSPRVRPETETHRLPTSASDVFLPQGTHAFEHQFREESTRFRIASRYLRTAFGHRSTTHALPFAAPRRQRTTSPCTSPPSPSTSTLPPPPGQLPCLAPPTRMLTTSLSRFLAVRSHSPGSMFRPVRTASERSAMREVVGLGLVWSCRRAAVLREARAACIEGCSFDFTYPPLPLVPGRGVELQQDRRSS